MDIKKLKTLREETGVSLVLCKKALDESGEDLEKAKKLLQQWGAEVLAKKATNITQEGAIFLLRPS
jgi:Translation elongation factor Ts